MYMPTGMSDIKDINILVSVQTDLRLYTPYTMGTGAKRATRVNLVLLKWVEP
jgi:hypothetical protein